MADLEKYFRKFRQNIVGIDFKHPFKNGEKQIIYADWAASGRLYHPIEKYIVNDLGPYVANTHTETTLTGTIMTDAYHQAHNIIKKHVNASKDDILLFAGFGMTAVINKFQRILGLRIPEKFKNRISFKGKDRPLVIITHMEHHSNQTSWAECLCDLEMIRRNENGLPDLNHLEEILKNYKDRKFIIGSFTACSNVTGIKTSYHEMAEIVHKYGGYCFIDFSASAPYVEINMHPKNKNQQLDAIFFSPHKFLGGPGSSGVIVFNKSLYHNTIPDNPGGGTVSWTNPWGEHHYFEDIEVREDGGTPGFLQGIKASLAILLKEKMRVTKILKREEYLKNVLMNKLQQIDIVNVLEHQQRNRICFISLFVKNIHHNLIVQLLNDMYGIQTRGGCSCAGTYGHVLLNIDYHESHRITHLIDSGNLSEKPGWVRISLHPTMINRDIEFIVAALEEVIKNYSKWEDQYRFNVHTGEFEAKEKSKFRVNLNNIQKYLLE